MQIDRILHYKIEHHLGSGSFGDVYQAYDEKLKRYVAIKISVPSDDKDMQKELATRFELEIGATVKLIHPNIVTVYDAGSTDDFLFYVMAHLSGGDLKKNNNKIIRNSEILQTCIDVTKALAYAHDMGFVHRDIKPENILFDTHGNAVVADFGIVKAMGMDYTVGRYVMGTPSYSAPEQLDINEEIDGRADLYSLGKVLHFMLVKRKYEPGDADTLPLERSIFAPVLNKLLSTNRNDRFENAHEVLRVFEELLLTVKQGETDKTVITESFKKPKGQKSNSKLIITMAIVSAIIAGIFAIIFMNNNPYDTGEPSEVVNQQNTNSDKVNSIKLASDAIVSITSNPIGAAVYIKGKKVGATPFMSESMPIGQLDVTLKKRFYKPQLVSFVLESKKINKKSIHLEKGVGSLSIITQPAGARVWIGGVAVTGITPLSIDDVVAGPQSIDIRKDNISLRRDIDVENNQVMLLRATLNEETSEIEVSQLPSSNSGKITLNSNPPGADVFIDGEKVGVTPFDSKAISAGIHRVKLSHKFYADSVFEARFGANTSVNRFVELKLGSGGLSVISHPENAIILLNNKLLKGITPVSLNAIPAGRHSIDIRKDGLRLQQDIEISNGAITVVEGNLEAGSLIAINNQFKSIEESLIAANSSDKPLDKIKIYKAILAIDSKHQDTQLALEQLKNTLIADIEILKNKHKYSEARATANIISENLRAHYELPDFNADITQHEQLFLLSDLKEAFTKQDKKIRALLKQNHHQEAESLIAALLDDYKVLDQYSALNRYFQNSKIKFEQSVLKITGPIPLVKVSGNSYLRSFAYEATFKQWDSCFNDGMCARKPSDFGWGRGNRPVVDVSFEEITTEFIPWINQKTGITFKLPTESQWKSLYGKASKVNKRYANGPKGFGWGFDSSDYTANVGSYIKNGNGLYDLNGNVWEWVDECGEASCARRVIKGGSWNSAPKFFSKDEKWLEFPVKRANDIGFRLVAEYSWQL